MKTRICYLLFAAAFVACGLITLSQSRGGNWPTYGGDAQRSGWEGADAAISKETVKNLQLIWKTKLETQSRGMRPVMPPIVQGRLISYRGFKELAFVATNADIVYAIDADVGTLFWQKHLEYSTREPQVTTSTPACPGGLTAMPTMPVPGRGGAAGRGAPAPAGGQRGSAFIGGPPSVYAISSDGRLHRLNTSTGDDMTQPVSVIPANARASGLNMVDNVIYTTTSHDCGDAPDAVWSIDLNVDPPKVRSFVLDGTSGWSVGGPTIGNDGSVHVPVISPANSDSSQRTIGLQSLTPRELKPSQQGGPIGSFNAGTSFGDFTQAASPTVFPYKDRDVVASACFAGALCIFEPTGSSFSALMPVVRQPTSGTARAGVFGGLSSWQDASGTRWVFAPVTGPLSSDLRPLLTNGSTPNGSIVAFKVEESKGSPILSPAWVSRDLDSPLPPVVVNGVVFALSAGEFTRQVKVSDGVTSVDERPKGSTSHATLYALDAQTGKELWSSRNQVNVPASLTGITVANGRVYFGGIDGTVYAFGMYMER